MKKMNLDIKKKKLYNSINKKYTVYLTFFFCKKCLIL